MLFLVSFYIANVVFFLSVKRIVDRGIWFGFIMVDNKNFSNIFLENICHWNIDYIWINCLLKRKNRNNQSHRNTLKKPHDLSVGISERFANHFQLQVESELRNKDNYIKRLLVQLLRQRYYLQNQNIKIKSENLIL